MVLNSQKWSTVRKKLFELFLEIINWETIQKSCDIIICGLHLTLRINYEKYKNAMISDTYGILSTYYGILATIKSTE